ncbi:hypothetical protein [Thermodesulfovibrio sp. TK110]
MKDLLKVFWYPEEGLILVKSKIFQSIDQFRSFIKRWILPEIGYPESTCLTGKIKDAYYAWNLKDSKAYVNNLILLTVMFMFLRKDKYKENMKALNEYYKSKLTIEGKIFFNIHFEKDEDFDVLRVLALLIKQHYLIGILRKTNKRITSEQLLSSVHSFKSLNLASLFSKHIARYRTEFNEMARKLTNYLISRQALNNNLELISLDRFVDVVVEIFERLEEPPLDKVNFYKEGKRQCLICGVRFTPKKGTWSLYCPQCRRHHPTIKKRLERLFRKINELPDDVRIVVKKLKEEKDTNERDELYEELKQLMPELFSLQRKHKSKS